MRYYRYLVKEGYLKGKPEKYSDKGWENQSLASLYEYLTKMKATSASKEN